ncbi:MAG: signal peptide peptidase SppA [Dorea sp.]|jgi:protease-4|uniref:signal peptide peptidase SppA n=1 Tax=Sporofaciens sp. JLR.KK001 TaxID=3112621 RepID=UPI00216DEC2D|nr:signal peptide peptidase SppA [Dorea sp.]
MNKKQIGGLIIAAVLFIAVGVSSVLTNTFSERMLADSMEQILTDSVGFDPPSDDYIAVVRVEGTIQEQTAAGMFDVPVGYQHITTLDYIDNLMGDGNNRGILLYVDSPGGTVYESEELYLKLKEYKEQTGRPVWDYMAHYAASGGYLISMAADKIYANPNTTTGSIGVIMSGFDMTGLYEKLGIRYVSITSGDFKDSSKMTDEQIAVYQEQVDEYYNKFVGIVAEGRGMAEEDVKTLADGRVYTANQALENGLVDEISLYEDMTAAMSSELGAYEFYEPESEISFFSSLFAKVESVIPKSEAQILTETAADMESGVPMYYAEQFR